MSIAPSVVCRQPIAIAVTSLETASSWSVNNHSQQARDIPMIRNASELSERAHGCFLFEWTTVYQKNPEMRAMELAAPLGAALAPPWPFLLLL